LKMGSERLGSHCSVTDAAPALRRDSPARRREQALRGDMIHKQNAQNKREDV
jgi:hypothetical protein